VRSRSKEIRGIYEGFWILGNPPGVFSVDLTRLGFAMDGRFYLCRQSRLQYGTICFSVILHD
jgi:hypothetical protein